MKGEGKYKSSVKGKDLCKICGYPFGLGEVKKSDDRNNHACHLVRMQNIDTETGEILGPPSLMREDLGRKLYNWEV